MRSKPHIAYFGMGPLPGHFGFTTDREAFEKELRRLGVKEHVEFVSRGAPASHHYFERQSGEFTSIVTLDLAKCKGHRKTAIAAVLAHEATHVWQANRDWMGEKKPGHETEAYAIQYFTECMLNHLERKRK